MKPIEQHAADLAMRFFGAGEARRRAEVAIAEAMEERFLAWDASFQKRIEESAARITELLEANNKYLEEARQARRERDALLAGFKGMARAIATMKDDTP